MKISNDITCTKPLTVAITAYLDWLNKPTIEKKMFENNIRIKWYSTVESTESTINILGPQTKFKQKRSWVANSIERKTGAATVVGRGIINISLVSILKRSANIWNAPFLPMRVGPIRLCAKARSLRSVSTTKSVVKTHISEINNANS
jgi:hypothetical protein